MMNSSENSVSIALVDDHILVRKGFAGVINQFIGFYVALEADNGIDLINQLSENNLPDIILLDINMPKMNGYDTAKYLKEHYPNVQILVLSMLDEEDLVIRMLKLGVVGYILKDAHPNQLESALKMIKMVGYYYSEWVKDILMNSKYESKANLTDEEIEFLRLICQQLTYKEMVPLLRITLKQIDKLRESMFKKLNVKCKVGLAMYAIKNGICKDI
jgi:two-component system, NarL family, invasion response regulator UvrY